MSQSFTAKTAIQCVSLYTPEQTHRRQTFNSREARKHRQLVNFVSSTCEWCLTSRSSKSLMLGHPCAPACKSFDDARLQLGGLGEGSN